MIADEAHHAAGPVSDFATVLDAAAIKAKRRLFMTATPRYFTGRVLREAKESDYEIASMDGQKFGTVFHRLSFCEAIDRKLLSDYRVVIVGVDDATYREFAQRGALVTRDGKSIENAAGLAGQIGLAKAMRKYDLRRVISFHSRVKRAQEFASSFPDVIDWMPARQRPKGRLWSDFVSGAMPVGDRHRRLQQLSHLHDAERGIVSNARCLSEGVDVPTLDGVAFVDPRRSEVDIVQAVGRAIRKSEAETGTIVIPVFVDTSADPELALDSSAFKPVWDVIKALRAHDDELGRQLDELRRELGRKGGKPRLPDKIRICLPATVGADFAAAIDVRLVERTTESWEWWFGLLQRYTAENGDSVVPAAYAVNQIPLGRWVVTQRRAKVLGLLSQERQDLLDSTPGWVWSTHDAKWQGTLHQLHRHVEVHGSLPVPADALCHWIINQRARYRSGKMEPERIEELERLPGWEWRTG